MFLGQKIGCLNHELHQTIVSNNVYTFTLSRDSRVVCRTRISAWLRQDARGQFRSAYCICVNRFLTPLIAEHESGHAASSIF